VFDILQVERFELGGDKFVVDSLGNVSVGGKVIINESLEVYKDVKIDGNLFVGGTIEAQDIKVREGIVTVWRGRFAIHPANPYEGDIYFNTSDSKLYMFTDGDWIVIN